MSTDNEKRRALSDDIDRQIMIRILDAPLIITDFVQGDAKSNYELYLVEVLNNSQWIKKQFHEPFVWRKDQSHGECDAYSGEYGIDFKRAAAKSKLQAKSLLSDQIYLEFPGAYSVCASKKTGEMTSTRLFAALRHHSVDELRVLAASTDKRRGIANDLAVFLQSIVKKKNLLLFFPYTFFMDNDIALNRKDLVDHVVSGLNNDFAAALSYRELVSPGFDTFFVTICESDFMLMKYQGGSLVLLDTIPTRDCDTFVHLKEYTEFWMD